MLTSDASGDSILKYYGSYGNDFYYIEVWIDTDRYVVDEIMEVLGNLKFKDL
ncbi:MAG: hypothetical protein R2883_01255 [Caldisericia bacterium]